MKETHIFYAPQVAEGITELPQEEAGHAVRVLRMKEGDALALTDGMGRFTMPTSRWPLTNIANLQLIRRGTTTNCGRETFTWQWLRPRIWTAWNGLRRKLQK